MHRRTGSPSRVARGRAVPRGAVLAALAALVLPLAACSGEDPAPAPTVTASPDTSVDKVAAPTPSPRTVWPLTGVATERVADRPALAVKVENSPQARPQSGLDAADVVWEEVVEGGITRFAVVYQSRVPGSVGPIRSVRPMDPNIVEPLRGPLVYTGGQPVFLRAVDRAGIQSIVMDKGDPGFHRDRSRSAPHNVYADPHDFYAQADSRHDSPPPAQLAFAESAGQSDVVTEGTPATRVTARFSPAQTSAWAWDAKSKRYLRSDGSEPAITPGGDRLGATNVVTLGVKVVDTKYKDPAGAPVPDTVVVGSGKGVVAAGGRSLRIAWSKKSAAAPLVLKDSAGDPVELAPGTVWIELVPTGSGAYSVG
ncbi:DUF3048 domain-containing protein [Cellulomonas sp. PhB143]|uniref:DUF3048 domain-containing protein n=1 Tax=Cellulomonas sp. PhB143 TaxID=2485186 RepID=UPI000F47862C|nr:DUF3048 domain-containing protein [Cellulomonas sp. PhB143]ROS76696.1 DUF3048 family protein [Cellulomonas sp. PhB143]